ncbi:HupE/UreJ family protein [Arcticibacterium luteifluviistationis]|uniref:HupE / UreJ protein n=1 Tax=Arcticibacterium luteifluviistationis TaxID=1784714 RepID=A0A2Z4GA48_9BACT|nr:HupE/UreJ family protein [Arcticibacterium luteifluviistationis]AWV97960.1 HupE / UreJ protein [Arcticibacterium luteifluviistationis]
MQEFLIYLKLGYQHITDLKGFDHILFIVALCAISSLKQWKSVLILITAFTLGHSITLALSTTGLIKVNPEFIEVLIPVTILITCIVNFFHKFKKSIYTEPKNKKFIRYLIASLFGLIHGLGFSNYLRSLLGSESSIIKPLFAFNLGLEFGQIIIVIGVLLLNFLMIIILDLRRKTWNLILSGIVFGMTLMLIINSL